MFYETSEERAFARDAAEEVADRPLLGVALDIHLKRLPRQRCSICHLRRVCFQLVVEDMNIALQGRPVCAQDAGIR